MSTSMAAHSPAPARPSSALVLAHEREDGAIAVYLVRRHARSDFMPDVFVFPGGSVQPDDVAVERAPGRCAPVHAGPTALGHGFRAAAIRECFEEAGVLLARRGPSLLALNRDAAERFAGYRAALHVGASSLLDVVTREDLTLATDELIHWAHWITPTIYPKRFETHFFLTAMPPRQEAAHDRLETSDGVWLSPEDALEGWSRGELPMADVTRHQLRALSGLATVAAARERFGARVPLPILPGVTQIDGEDTLLVPDGAG